MSVLPDSGVLILINEVASKLPLIDKSDLSILTEVMTALIKISESPDASKQVKTVALRAAQIAEGIIFDEVPFVSGCKRLSEGVIRIEALISNTIPVSRNDNKADAPSAKKTVCEPLNYENRVPILEDAVELAGKFISSQQSVLEILEEKALAIEKGDAGELTSVKRLLHTMKGEFGVLNLQIYALLIHKVEGAIDSNSFGPDNMLRLKDLLGRKLTQFNNDSFPGISEAEFNYVFTSFIKVDVSCGLLQKSNEKNSTSYKSIENQLKNDLSLTGDFITESRDHINVAESLLLELEINPQNAEHLNSVFRSCHTIKGVAGFLGLLDIGKLAHTMENLMDIARKGEILINPGHIDLLLEAMDCLKEFIGIVESTSMGEDFRIPESYDSVMQRLGNAVNIIKEIKPVAGFENSKIGEILVKRGAVSNDEIQGALNKQLQGDNRKLGQILIKDNGVAARDVGDALANQVVAKSSKVVEETIRVPVTRLDQLIDAIGEAVIAQSMITADPVVKESSSQSLLSKLNQANLIMRQIQELSMSLRMVSIKSTFQKMSRLVRDLSKKSGKQVDFITEGEDTEIDKSVIENIGDPLIHMMRNSMDHGIETEEERSLLGKAPIARVTLRAYQKSGSVFIELSDDGRGMDKEVILRKGIEKGLCNENHKLTDQEIYQFIFLPGFSTAKQITDISGRGVGMDVVKRNVELLRGSIDIQTELGVGTTFTIRLPLTLAIIDGMVVRLGTDFYIVPTLSIVETIAVKKEAVQSVLGQGEMIQVRGDLLPLLYLSKLFGCKASEGSQYVALIVEDTLGKQAGIVIDEIIGQQQVVIKNLGSGIIDVQGISGGAIMSDGTVSLILDIGGIIKNVY